MRDPLERQSPRVHAVGEENRQRSLDPGNAAPGLPDVVITLLLVRGGAGRMIGGDEIDAPGQQLCP